MRAILGWVPRLGRACRPSRPSQRRQKASIFTDASNLILALQGKVYEDWACTSVTGELSLVAVKEVQQTVRSRVLELTLELEKRVPEAVSVTLEKKMPDAEKRKEAVTRAFERTIYGVAGSSSGAS